MVEIIWKEPPPSISNEKAEVIAELQKQPGRWALVQQDKSSSSSAAPWQKIGCQAKAHRKNPGEKVPKYDVYAGWPEAKASKPASATPPKPLPVGRVAVEQAVSTGTAIKPPAPAAPRPSLPAPKASGGYSQFLANQRAGTVPAAAE